MALARLICEWRDRLFRLRTVGAESAPGAAWLIAIRVRILTFLLTRYENAAVRTQEPPPTAPEPSPPAFCEVEDPAGPGPRRGSEIAPVLRDIRRCNAESRPRWRFWF